MEISKNGYSTYKRTSKRPEEMLQMIFVYISTMLSVMQNDYVNGMPGNVASMRLLTKRQPQYFIEYKTIPKNFAVINHQYIDI